MAKLTRSQRRSAAANLAQKQRVMVDAVMPASNGNGHVEVQREKDPLTLTSQPRFTDAQSVFASVYRWVMEANMQEPELRPDSGLRDKWLREFVKREPHLVGVMNSVVQVDGNRGWTLTGGRNLVNKFTDILKDNYYVTPDLYGWRPGVKASAEAFYTSDLGTVIEVGREGANGPLRGLFHVDPARCKLTGNPEAPLMYQPAMGGPQEWYPEDYFRLTSLVSTDEALRGLGFCAISRCLELAKVMVAVYLHDQEQLGTRAPRGLLLLKNISQNSWDDAMTARNEDLDSRNQQLYGGLAVLAGMGPADVDAKLIALSQLPLGFDLDKFTSLLMYGYALAFGYDPREFWPVSGGQLGTATETETMHLKATGKGGLDFALSHQENIQRLLPEALQFEYESRDDQGAMLESQAEMAKAQLPLALYNAGLPQGAPSISKEELRVLLAERGLIPEEWTLIQEDVTSTDVEDAEAADEQIPTATPDAANTPPAETSTPPPLPPGNTPQQRRLTEWAMSLPAVQRSLALYPTEPIVRRHWPSGRVSVLFDPNAIRPKQWNGSGVHRASPKEVREFNEEDHPRDESGKFTSSGGAGAGETNKPDDMAPLGLAHMPASNVYYDAESFADKAAETARLLKELDAEDVRVNLLWNEPAPTFTLNGKEMYTAGNYNPETGEVNAYAGMIAMGNSYKGILTHEVTHAKFDTVEKAWNEEWNRMRALPPEEYDKVHSFVTGVKAEYAKEYPVTAALFKSPRNDIQKLSRLDGVTQYSTEWWDQAATYHDQRWDKAAVNETLAEVAELRVSKPDEYAKVHPIWRRMESTYAKLYKQLKHPKGKKSRELEDVGDCIIAYFNDKLEPCPKEKATLMKVVYLNGRTLFAIPKDITRDFNEEDHPRDESGRFASSGSSGSVHIKGTLSHLPKEKRVWQGKQHPGTNPFTKEESGKLGEDIAMESLTALNNTPYQTTNVGLNNYPIDAGGDSEAIEIKTGVVTNSPSAQQFRATIGEPGKEEKALLAKLSAEDKRKYNDVKREKILERKQQALDEMSKAKGHPVKPYTVCVFLSPDGKRADVHKIPGFHLRLGWNGSLVRDNYVGTFEVKQ